MSKEHNSLPKIKLTVAALLVVGGGLTADNAHKDAQNLNQERVAVSRIYRESPPWPQLNDPPDYHPLTSIEDQIRKQLQEGDTIHLQLSYNERMKILISFSLRDDARKAGDLELKFDKSNSERKLTDALMGTTGLGTTGLGVVLLFETAWQMILRRRLTLQNSG